MRVRPVSEIMNIIESLQKYEFPKGGIVEKLQQIAWNAEFKLEINDLQLKLNINQAYFEWMGIQYPMSLPVGVELSENAECVLNEMFYIRDRMEQLSCWYGICPKPANYQPPITSEHCCVVNTAWDLQHYLDVTANSPNDLDNYSYETYVVSLKTIKPYHFVNQYYKLDKVGTCQLFYVKQLNEHILVNIIGNGL